MPDHLEQALDDDQRRHTQDRVRLATGALHGAHCARQTRSIDLDVTRLMVTSRFGQAAVRPSRSFRSPSRSIWRTRSRV
ncbi:MAG TPA: hypothetical protein VKD72_18870, partial [Gemmataceae bacterium]|nr:hypothetical protein [Gemmataceae bacterium]